MPVTVNTLRDGFEPKGGTEWGAYRELRRREVIVAGFHLQAKVGMLTVRDTSFARALTNADQAVIGDEVFEIVQALLPERPDGTVQLEVVSAPSRALYAREFETIGEAVTLRRIVPNAAPVEAVARAIVTGFQPDELVGGIQQGERKVLLSAADLEDTGFPAPPKPNDRLIVRGRALTITEVDDSSHRYAGVLNAYQIRTSA